MNNLTVADYASITQRNYVSELEHRLKESADNDSFIRYLIQEISLDQLYEQKQYEKLYYTIALVKYLKCMDEEKKNQYIKKYSEGKLKNITYSNGVEIYCNIMQSDDLKKEQLKNAIPEFLKYNLVVTSVGDVV